MKSESSINGVTAAMIDQNIITPNDVLLDTKTVAAMLGFSIKWLEAAREGRKGIQGPPYVKLGQGRTAPIRYNLAQLRDWMSNLSHLLPDYQPCQHVDYKTFISSATPDENWPFVVQEGSNRVELFKAINSGLLGGPDKQANVEWIPKRDLAKYSVVSE